MKNKKFILSKSSIKDYFETYENISTKEDKDDVDEYDF